MTEVNPVASWLSDNSRYIDSVMLNPDLSSGQVYFSISYFQYVTDARDPETIHETSSGQGSG